MSETNIIFIIALAMVGVFFGLLMTVLGWMGNKLYAKVDEMSKNLVTMAGELHARINDHGERIVKLETEHKVCDLLNVDKKG